MSSCESPGVIHRSNPISSDERGAAENCLCGVPDLIEEEQQGDQEEGETQLEARDAVA
jgi:hypothetical protein